MSDSPTPNHRSLSTNETAKKARRVAFLTGTRADFGKLSPIIKAFDERPEYFVEIVATGMHLLKRYDHTIVEITKAGFTNVFPIFNQDSSTSEKMDIVLANTIAQLSHYLNERRPDLMIVHGDRVETLAGAIAGALNNIRVAHVEGGEVSGTIDESMRHAVSKLAHIHLVANEEARRRVLQLGERSSSIFVVGSPEVDVMKSGRLPPLNEVQRHYRIPFTEYAILAYHPVTTEVGELEQKTRALLAALDRSGDNFIAIKPNNDIGSMILEAQIKIFSQNDRVMLFSSLRFERYLTLLKHAKYIVGNSSSGIREAPVFGVPCVNVGTRQNNRIRGAKSSFNVPEDTEVILKMIRSLPERVVPGEPFGDGNAVARILACFDNPETWATPTQKIFHDRLTEGASEVSPSTGFTGGA